MEDDIYHQGQWFKFKLITNPSGRSRAASFLASLSEDEIVDLLATFSIFERSLRSGREMAGRARKVRGSTVGLIELKFDRCRIFVVLSGDTIWIADGFRKTSPEVQRYNTRAEAIVRNWEPPDGPKLGQGSRRGRRPRRGSR